MTRRVVLSLMIMTASLNTTLILFIVYMMENIKMISCYACPVLFENQPFNKTGWHHNALDIFSVDRAVQEWTEEDV